ncbi:hypothetical protein [Bacillus swezeyi]|uniref:hypothetical protein n=1 Tax=Bacillus swezeyi TaxID=1925020 RepID=UPI003F889FB2
MLSKHSKDQREQREVVALSELVPEDHLVRKMEDAMDFSFIYEKAFKRKLELIRSNSIKKLTPIANRTVKSP